MLKNILKNQKGAIAILTLMGVSIFALTVMITVNILAVGELKMSASEEATEMTFYGAEAGINEALYRLIEHPVPEDFTLAMEEIDIEVTVEANPDNPYQRIIRSQATDPTGKVRTIQILANTSSWSGGFDYAVQAGEGGLEMMNNSEVIGDIYSNGNIFGGTGGSIQARVDGNTWVARGEPEVAGPSQESSNLDLDVARESSSTDVAQSFKVSDDIPLKKVSLYLKRVGNLPADPTFKIVNDDGFGSPGTDIIVEQTIKKNDIPNSLEWFEIKFNIGPILFADTTYWMVLDSNSFNSNKYLVWSFNTNPGSYSEGEAKKTDNYENGNWQALNGDFKFRTIFGLGDTFIDQMEVSGDLHANTIESSEVSGDAYFQNIIDTDVAGQQFPGSEDPDPKPFPITDTDIANWKEDAAAGGEIVGDKNISGTELLGPVKIVGNLSLGGNAHLIQTGNLWVTGNITFTNPNSEISLAPSIGEGSGVLIADGKIDINNNTAISGSGDPKSYLLILSTHNSLYPASPAINAANNSEAVVFYAAHGLVRIYNNSQLNGTSGYFVRLEEQSSITYDPNLQVFTIPEGGDDDIGTAFGTWQEL